jgi:hypothetical protein
VQTKFAMEIRQEECYLCLLLLLCKWIIDPNTNSYSSHTTNNDRTYYYDSDDRAYFHYDYEGNFCVDVRSNRLSDMENCKFEDRIEKRMLLSEEIPLLKVRKIQ